MRKHLLLFGLLLFGFVFKAQSQEDMFKALFVYNFIKDIEWPADYKQGNFIITVYGASGISEELEKIAAKKKVGNQTIEVKKVNNTAEIGKTHIVYITSSKSNDLQDINSNVSSKPVLVITDKEGMASKGAGINFVTRDGKQKFEINPATISSKGLKVNTFLTSLGIVVQ